MPVTVIPLPNSEYMVVGSVSVTLTGGAGTLTVPYISTIDEIEVSIAKTSPGSELYLVTKTGPPSGNTVPILVTTQPIGGTAANPSADTATSETIFFKAIGH